VGCQLKSDQAIRSLCLKGHVRARGSTLWRHRWQDASEFLCIETPLFGESWETKNIAKKNQKCFLWRATNVMFSKLSKKGNRGFFETALCAVLINPLINWLIRINSGPNVLRSCFLHWISSQVGKIIDPTSNMYIVVLYPKNAINDTSITLNWISGTDNLSTCRSPAWSPVFSWFFWFLYLGHTFTKNRIFLWE